MLVIFKMQLCKVLQKLKLDNELRAVVENMHADPVEVLSRGADFSLTLTEQFIFLDHFLTCGNHELSDHLLTYL